MLQAELKIHFTSLYSVKLTPSGWERIVHSRRSHHVHNITFALSDISYSQIFFGLDCRYFLYDILVFFSNFGENLLSY